ncbi:MAG: transposase, partial [Acidobacteriaceae bacterium]
LAKSLPRQAALFKIPYQTLDLCPAPTKPLNNRSRISHASTSTCNRLYEKSGLARMDTVEDTLRLTGWDKSRRVVILRRPAKSEVALTRKAAEGQMELLLPGQDVELWEYAVLVTNSGYALESMAQLYRDRADAENGFDELKNQWGWGGFTTQDIERCQSSARAVALVYNWWSWYCRAARPEARMEAITSRALLLAAVGRATQHAGKTTLYLTTMHAARKALMLLIANIHAALSHVRKVAEQSPATDRWKTLLDYIVARILPHRPQKLLKTCALLASDCGF